jgi:uncharacterized protein YggU (UPF0235/DUF167 family)
VRVTPRGGRDTFAAGTDDHFAARVTAAPADGAANAAVTGLVAQTFGVARGAVRLDSGATARIKRLSVSGDPATLARIVASLYGAEP